MIYGIGTDLVAISRMDDLVNRYGRRFASRILTRLELIEYDDTKRPSVFLAKHFAAKEAFAKAIGSGLRSPVNLKSIGIEHDILGAPNFILDDTLNKHLAKLGIKRSLLSIADEINHAMAFVVLEKL